MNNINKKLLSLLLVLSLVLCALASCGGNGSGTETEGKETESGTTVQMYKPEALEDPTQVILSTESYSFNAAEVSYIFFSTYQNLLYNIEYYYGGDFEGFGLDVTKSLKEQTCTMDVTVKTWFEYFMRQTVESGSWILSACEAAKKSGFEAPSSVAEEVERVVSDITSAAKDYGITANEYLANTMSTNVTLSAVKTTMEKLYYANAYLEACVERLDLSDAALEAMYAQNPDVADTVDFIAYGFDYTELIPEGADEAAKAEALDLCRSLANAAASQTSVEDFKASIKAALTNSFGFSDEDAEKAIEKSVYSGFSYSEDSIVEWAFDAAEGSAGTVEDEESGLVYAVMLTKRNPKSEEVTSRAVRHILFKHDTYEDDTKVREVYDNWVAGGASVEDFIKLAAEYSEDPGSKDAGGLYEGVTEGQMVEEFNDWLFDEARVAGDHAIVESASYGWHIMYYEGGEAEWKTDLKQQLQSDAYDDALAEAESTYPVTVDEEASDALPA